MYERDKISEQNWKGYLATARTKPSLLLKGSTPRLIDEWQVAPVIWDAVRHAVDERRDLEAGRQIGQIDGVLEIVSGLPNGGRNLFRTARETERECSRHEDRPCAQSSFHAHPLSTTNTLTLIAGATAFFKPSTSSIYISSREVVL